ncbi:TPA: S9 family peptidase [Vibrio vulnificus]|uniref:prolyl oligopeptidase family serine peptidase n=1 Tax=Vibrio vulnificus TaxID=672 RepID=UPI00102CA58D|nr:prolyl oligopeptidase family serine peptidase [Vibrio vulnificus]MCU8179013.1 prolyl oligopeptidase family serine peptidase [Vibrio vulnificus]RZR47862.1 S9 family peptidase [Vibrio vulnificus]HAS8429142.1 S9 family peptidase [Vibrio vulnificus]
MKFIHLLLMLAWLPAGLIFAQNSSVTDKDAKDKYEWLRDDSRSSPRVRAYLEEQNQLTAQRLLESESLAHMLEEQWQAMQPEKGEEPWGYREGEEWKLTNQGGSLQLMRRDPFTQRAEVVFSFSERQNNTAYYQVGEWAISANRTHLLFTEDRQGSERYQAVLVDLKQGHMVEIAKDLDTPVLLSRDGLTAYVIEKDQSQRPSNIMAIELETGRQHSLWQETRADWLMSFYAASDANYALLQSNNENSSEQKILDLRTGEVSAVLRKAEQGMEYYADISQQTLFVQSNHAGDFQLYQAPLQAPTDWQRFSDHITTLNQFYLFSAGVVVSASQGPDSLLSVLSYRGELRKQIPLNHAGEAAWVSRNGDFASNKVRIRSMSMTTPPTWRELDVSSLSIKEIAQDRYANYQPSLYRTEQILVQSSGVEVPVTLAYRRDKLTATSPVILYGYGAYGFTMKPYFMPQTISLLDQGAIYAVAHVRGGGYFGASWHDAGKGINKSNAIADFVAAAQTLRHVRLNGEGAEPVQRDIYLMGSSAGGTLVAAAINQKPELFSGAVIKVPFVDVLNSMSDSRLPLTEQQYGEWGNPELPAQRKAMQDYDPYLNLQSATYPPMLVQIGWHDQRVPYWEGAKYLTKLAALSTGTGPYLLQTDFDSGHAMDRRKGLAQQAKEYAFLLSLIKTSNKSEQ